MRWFLLFLVILTNLSFAEDTLTPEERLELDPGVVLPQDTQRLIGGSCDWFLERIAQNLSKREPTLDMQGFACYMKVSELPSNQLIEGFNTSLSAAGYQMIDETHNIMMQQPGNVFQIWASSGGYIFIVTHVYATPEHFAAAGVTTTVSLFVDPSNVSMDYETKAAALAFDPAIAFPEGTAQIEGTSCDVSIEGVLGFLENMSRPTEHLSKHRCYILRADNWKVSAEEVMASFENAGYISERLTSEDFNLPVIVQIWAKEGSAHPLTVYFGESRTGRGLFMVVSRD
jgi:hypothetical protein